MGVRRAERLRLFDSTVLHRADFELRHGVDWMQNEELAGFLRFSNMRILGVGASRPLRARIALFPFMTFAHVNSSPTEVLWPRDEKSIDRALLIITRAGGLDVETDGVVLRRPGVALITPGDDAVTIRLTEEENEVVYASVSPAVLEEVSLPSTSRTETTCPDPAILSPSVMFISGLCRISTRSSDAVAPLKMAARQVTRTLFSQVAGEDPPPPSLFARAMALIVADHADPLFSVGGAARRLGVSGRTLQLAFKAEGTTAIAQVNDVRARGALRLHQTSPSSTAEEIARAVGFASTAALSRALREVDADERSEP
ncbi:MAG: helix-turn-helix domain-containing protein [Microbacterium sp.]|nr:helix-turn-helix domain-containing protein [Microbacterium sp.]